MKSLFVGHVSHSHLGFLDVSRTVLENIGALSALECLGNHFGRINLS